MFRNPLLAKVQVMYREVNESHDCIYSVFASGLRHRDGVPRKLTEKESVEAKQLLLFALSYPQFPDGSVSIGKNPDFVVDADKKVGIEITCPYVQLPGHDPIKPEHSKMSMLKMQESLQDRIVEQAYQSFTTSGGPSLLVSFSFIAKTNFCAGDVPRAAEQLVKCVPHSLASSQERVTLQAGDLPGDWPEYLSCIVAGVRPEFLRDVPCWRASHGGWVQCSEKFFQGAIDNKESKFDCYRRSDCDQLWLLLVVEGLSQASFMDPPSPQHVFESSFDRVVAFWLYDKKVLDLRVVRPRSERVGATHSLPSSA